MAEINGISHQIIIETDSIVIQSPQFHGEFLGKLNGHVIEGFWKQKGYQNFSGFVSPLNLIKSHENIWKATFIPLPQILTLSIQFEEVNGIIIPKIRNREMNIGVFLNISYVEIEDNTLRFYSKDKEEKFQANLIGKELQLKFELWGSNYEFILQSKHSPYSIGFYPKTIAEYEVNTQLGDLHRSILDETYPNVQGIFISQNGKKLFERYYYGYYRDDYHDTRSAGKSLASILIGICIDKGYINSEDDAILDYFPDYVPNENWSDLKKLITIKHLMTMSSGLDCDDNNPFVNPAIVEVEAP